MTLHVCAGYDPARSGPLSVTLAETGGGGATGTVTITNPIIHHTTDLTAISVTDEAGEFGTLDLGYYASAAQLKAALEVVGNATYTVTLSSAGIFTVTASGGGVTAFSLASPSTGFTRAFGGLAGTSALVQTSSYACWYRMNGTVGALSAIVLPYESGDIAQDMIADDGTHYGYAMPGAAKRFECTVPLEPAAACYTISGNAYTWERLKRHARNIEPITIYDSNSARTFVCKLREDSAAIKPKQISANYLGHFNVDLNCHYLGDA